MYIFFNLNYDLTFSHYQFCVYYFFQITSKTYIRMSTLNQYSQTVFCSFLECKKVLQIFTKKKQFLLIATVFFQVSSYASKEAFNSNMNIKKFFAHEFTIKIIYLRYIIVWQVNKIKSFTLFERINPKQKAILITKYSQIGTLLAISD